MRKRALVGRRTLCRSGRFCGEFMRAGVYDSRTANCRKLFSINLWGVSWGLQPLATLPLGKFEIGQMTLDERLRSSDRCATHVVVRYPKRYDTLSVSELVRSTRFDYRYHSRCERLGVILLSLADLNRTTGKRGKSWSDREWEHVRSPSIVDIPSRFFTAIEHNACLEGLKTWDPK